MLGKEYRNKNRNILFRNHGTVQDDKYFTAKYVWFDRSTHVVSWGTT